MEVEGWGEVVGLAILVKLEDGTLRKHCPSTS